MSDKKYTLTVYVAAPGTPLFNENGSPKLKDGKQDTSGPGHVFYAISEDGGKTRQAYGFAPPQNADKFHWWSTDMPGDVEKDEHKVYRNPLYARTMEISEKQFNALREFGERSEKYGFNKNVYSWKNNSCIDFTYAALAHSGIYTNKSRDYHLLGQKVGTIDTGEKAATKVLGNIPEFEKIKDPYPGSNLNRRIPADMKDLEKNMPNRSLWQWILSENERNLDGSRPQYAQAAPQPRLEDLPQRAQNIYHQGKEIFTEFCGYYKIPYRQEDLNNICMAMAAAGYKERMHGVSLIDIENGEISIAHESPNLREAVIRMDQAAQTPAEESISRIQQTERQFEQQELERQMAQSQSRSMSLS